MTPFERSKEIIDRVCDECGLMHMDGISWHGRCYNCGGDLIAWDDKDNELVGITPKGIEIYERKTN